MTREKISNRLKSFITCLKCEVSGKCCNDNCPTQYEAGNMGEIIENLEVILKVLEQGSIESVLEDIKAEINDLSELDHIDADYEDCKADVLEIIDKHIGK